MFQVKATVNGEGNSYADVEFANSYFADRNNAAWTGTDTAKQGALVQATDYIQGRFSRRFSDETLEATSIPSDLQKATAEYALRALTGQLAPDPTVDASGVGVVKTRKKLGPLETEFQIVGSGRVSTFRSYPAADLLIVGLLNTGGNRVYR